ncbi:hypothetical protein RIO-1_7 [Pseudoalteromonas phage RIO-1]|uniref:Uncharacterized protein n=1 Tax=Pseudoalteromonas phage RIO-1 TaxID=1316739 RepID=R4JGT7_9CAUD|nr:hypothetical protein RIO-1_7 [Pseudoalteromonas phage RIO-1]AGK87021.1 hypothetical protein RIO-1_7 [Pseudoalteromonas phage RIO-1]
MPIVKFSNGQTESGGCFGFFGRLDDYSTEGSGVWQLASSVGTTCIVHPKSDWTGDYFNNESLGYLTWLFTESPYREVFISTPEEAIQEGHCTINLDVCNQTLILGLSHLRKSGSELHRAWNAMPEGLNGGLKVILCGALHSHASSTDSKLGAGYGDNTATVFRRFKADTLAAWLQGKTIRHESYMSLGGYHVSESDPDEDCDNVSFCDRYLEAYDGEGEDLEDLLHDVISTTWRTRAYKGMFFDGHVSVCEVTPEQLAEQAVACIEQHTDFKVCKEFLWK